MSLKKWTLYFLYFSSQANDTFSCGNVWYIEGRQRESIKLVYIFRWIIEINPYIKSSWGKYVTFIRVFRFLDRKLVYFVKMDAIHNPLHKLYMHIPMVYRHKNGQSYLRFVVHTNAQKWINSFHCCIIPSIIQWTYMKNKSCFIILNIMTCFKQIEGKHFNNLCKSFGEEKYI